MKRHLQTQGTRKWYGEHLIELQDEALKAIDAMASTLGACVISGCEIYDIEDNDFKMTDGLIALPCSDGKMRIMPYVDDKVITGYNEDLYLISSYVDIIGEYLNPISTVIAKNWTAVWNNTEPSHGGLLKKASGDLPRFLNLIENNMSGIFEPIFLKKSAFNKNFGQGSSDVEVGSNNPSGLKTRKIDIGEWNMQQNNSKIIDISSYNIATLIDIDVSIKVGYIDTMYEYRLTLSAGGYWLYNQNDKKLVLYRDNDSIFLSYDMSFNNKGYVILTYL